MDPFDEELEGLVLTFPEITCSNRRLTFPCAVMAGEAAFVELTALLVVPDDYPTSAVRVELRTVRGPCESEVARSVTSLAAVATEHAGESSCFQILLAVQNEAQRLADSIRCCICLDAVRCHSAPVFRSIGCGHCFHDRCIFDYADHVNAAFKASDEYLGLMRAAQQSLAPFEGSMRRDQAAHAALEAQLKSASAQLSDAEQRHADILERLRFEVAGTPAAGLLEADAATTMEAMQSAASSIKTLRRELSAAGARAGRSLAAYEDAAKTVATSASAKTKAAVLCPLCRNPFIQAQLDELYSRYAPVVAEAMGSCESLDHTALVAPSSATARAMPSSSSDPSIPRGLDNDTAAFVLRERARFAVAYQRQLDAGSFFAPRSDA
jgi:hypothetical protein